jgi:hypothetical protein
MADFRRLYPEYKDLNDDTLSHRMYEKANIAIKPTPEPSTALGVAVAWSFGVPLAVLLFGVAIAWALSGFSSQQLKG